MSCTGRVMACRRPRRPGPLAAGQSWPDRIKVAQRCTGLTMHRFAEDLYPVEWAGGQAVVTLPEHIGISNAGRVREELLSVITRGATTLIADMTGTVSCDHAGADAVIRARQRAAASGTELRLVVTAQIVALVLSLVCLDRVVSVYPSL